MLAGLISLTYLSVVKPKPTPIAEIEKRGEEIIEEKKEELEIKEGEKIEKPVVEEAAETHVEEVSEEVKLEERIMEPSMVEHEPELDILEEIVKELEEEKIEEKKIEEEAPVTEKELLKKCKHCGEMIPSDSFYCPLCGGRQEE